MDIHLPAPPTKKKKGLTIPQLSHRWRKKNAHVRHILRQAAIPIVPIEQPPVEGVLMSDLLKFEQLVRQELKEGAAGTKADSRRQQLLAIANDSTCSDDAHETALHDLSLES